MKWIKVVTGIAADDRVRALASALGVKYRDAVGMCVLIFLQLPQFAKDGNVGKLEPAFLEGMAQWDGKRGKFAAAFLAHLCEHGIALEWEELNGAAIRESERETKRKADYRANRKDSPANVPPSVPPNVPRDKRRTNGGRRLELLRDISGDVNGVERELPPVTRLSQPNTAVKLESGSAAGPSPDRAGLPQSREDLF